MAHDDDLTQDYSYLSARHRPASHRSGISSRCTLSPQPVHGIASDPPLAMARFHRSHHGVYYTGGAGPQPSDATGYGPERPRDWPMMNRWLGVLQAATVKKTKYNYPVPSLRVTEVRRVGVVTGKLFLLRCDVNIHAQYIATKPFGEAWPRRLPQRGAGTWPPLFLRQPQRRSTYGWADAMQLERTGLPGY